MDGVGWIEMHTAAKMTSALEEEVRRVVRDEMSRELARREMESRQPADPTADGADDVDRH